MGGRIITINLKYYAEWMFSTAPSIKCISSNNFMSIACASLKRIHKEIRFAADDRFFRVWLYSWVERQTQLLRDSLNIIQTSHLEKDLCKALGDNYSNIALSRKKKNTRIISTVGD